MLTLEEVKKRGLTIAGTRPEPNFVISMHYGPHVDKNMFLTNEIQDLLNKNLILSNYTNSMNSLFISVSRPYDGTGVNWKERKLFKRKAKKLIIDVVFEEYEQYCRATKKEALKILAKQIVAAVEKYLPKIKEIDYKKFRTDLIALFKEHKLIDNDNL